VTALGLSRDRLGLLALASLPLCLAAWTGMSGRVWGIAGLTLPWQAEVSKGQGLDVLFGDGVVDPAGVLVPVTTPVVVWGLAVLDGGPGVALAVLAVVLAGCVWLLGRGGGAQGVGAAAVALLGGLLPWAVSGRAEVWAAPALIGVLAAVAQGRVGLALLSAVLAEGLVPGAGRLVALAAGVNALAAGRGRTAAATALVGAVAVGWLLPPPAVAALEPMADARWLMLGVVGAGIAVVGAGPGRWAGVAAVVLALGPTLQWGDVAPVVGGRLVPLPATLAAAVPGLAGRWELGALVGVLAGAMSLREHPEQTGSVRPRWWSWAAGLSVTLGVLVVNPAAWWGVSAPDVRAERALAASPGAALHLPIAPVEPDPWRARWLLAGARAGAPSLVGHRVADVSTLYADPLMVVALALVAPDLGLLVPPGRPGAALSGAGARSVVVHRNAVSDEVLVVLEPVLRSALGPPVRDNVAGVDVYRVQVDPQVADPVALVPSGSVAPAGWKALDDWLARPGRP
jgi:hypothetical protein